MDRIFSGKNGVKIALKRNGGFLILELVISMALLMIFIKGICILQGHLFSAYGAMQRRMQVISQVTQSVESGQQGEIREITCYFKNKKASGTPSFSSTIKLISIPLNTENNQKLNIFHGALTKVYDA